MASLDHIFFEGDPPLRRTARQRSPLRPVPPRTAPQVCGAKPLDPFIAWLFQRAGIEADAYRPNALQRRLPACLRALRATSTEQARAILDQKPDLLPQAVSAILIGVSEFFRDPHVWDYLRAEFLPGLIRQRRTLRVHSAGCSEGQELYSMAILLDELGALEGSVLLGEDCRPDAIGRARAGMYDPPDIESIPRYRNERYFQKVGAQCCIVPRLRNHVCWEVRDLFALCGPGDADILLFRNVAIYLEDSQSGLLWERLFAQMAPGGILVTGKAERPPATLMLQRLSPCVYQKSERSA